MVIIARKVTLVSDITGAEADESEFIQLVVRQHPKIDHPRQLDVLPAETEKLKTVDNLVVMEVKNNGEAREVVMTYAEFKKLVDDKTVVSAPGTRGRRPGFSPRRPAASNGDADKSE